MPEKYNENNFERRCRLANLMVRTAIIEALPTLEPEQWHSLEIGLEKQLLDDEEVRKYAPLAAEIVTTGMFFGVKTLRLRLGVQPPAAKVDIEMGAAPIGYLQGNSVHLFDD